MRKLFTFIPISYRISARFFDRALPLTVPNFLIANNSAVIDDQLYPMLYLLDWDRDSLENDLKPQYGFLLEIR